MDSLYDDVETSEQFPRHRRQSSSDLSASSAEQAGQVPPSAHHHHHHHHHQFHGPLRYNQQPRPYPSRRLEQSSESRQSRDRHRGSSSSSESASSRSSHSSHSANTHPHNGDEDEDDDGYFLSAVSGLPSIEVEDLRHTRGSSEEAAVSVEAPTSHLDEDYAVPTWSQGSRLLERRIQQAVDQETMELEEETPWSRRAGQTANASLTAEFLAGGRLQPGPPPLAPLSAAPTSLLNETASAAVAAAAPALNAGPLRMQEAKLQADPRNRLLDLVITNTSASVTLGEIEQTMQWSTRYEPMYGALLEYLQSYQSIFVVSPVDDRVRLRRHFSIRTAAALRERGVASQQPASSSSPPTQQQQRSSRSRLRSRRGVRETAVLRSPSAVDRRSGKPSLPSAEALAAHIGSVSYSCVGEHLNLDTLEVVYRRRGYETAMMHAVLHVTSENDFHLFLFASGAVVWWGMDRKDHWMVEDDFLSPTTHIAEGVAYRYVQSEIEALFPIWCSYEVDEQCVDMAIHSPLGIRPAAVKPSLEHLSKVLCFDHYLVPSSEPARSLVMLTFSHSLGRSARVDYFEYVTKWSHRHILSIPAEFSGLLDYFSTKRRIAKLEGEIEVAQLAIQSIHDTPEVLWEVPWLQAYYDLAEQQNTAQSRLSWFTSRSDTLLEQLSHIKARRHRLFMLGSDVFLIVILILDVMFMTSRLVAKMYFKVEED